MKPVAEKLIRWAPWIAAVLLVTTAAFASGIKAWSNGETLKATDLNANFTHIHNTMVGGHGARLVNSDISASAGIAHSKMATPALLPKAWALTTTPCNGSAAAGTACGSTNLVGFSGVASTGTNGIYLATLTTPGADTSFIAIAQCASGAGATECYCTATPITTSTIGIYCRDGASALTNYNFNLLVLDN